MDNPEIKFFVHDVYKRDLISFPWNIPLEEWESQKVRLLKFRKGLSRHEVRFVKGKAYNYAIKQTNEKMAQFETKNYLRLLEAGIHTLLPVGYIVSEKPMIPVGTKIGTTYIKNNSAFIITVLDEKALPDSYLYKLNFKEDNRKIIWNAVAELLATLHFYNIYWGDASLANMLVRFFKVRDQKGRVRTQLKAFLADAETVEFHDKISNTLRKEDLNFFFESMNWLNQDYMLAGLTRKNFSTASDKKYILEKYNKHYKLLKRIKKFEKNTGLNVKRNFKLITDLHALDAIRKQIDEHKWYLSEKAGKEISTKEAARLWLVQIYNPIIDEFDTLNIFEYFPFKTSSRLFVDVMTHKYYMSQDAGRDIGIEKAIMDYSRKFANNISFIPLIKEQIKTLKKLFY